MPPIDAVMTAVPGATAATANVALDDPAGIVSVAGTLATAALLLASEGSCLPPAPRPTRVTVPCTLPPAAMLLALSATAVMPVDVDVAAVDDPPH